jgi:hypothetical protein
MSYCPAGPGASPAFWQVCGRQAPSRPHCMPGAVPPLMPGSAPMAPAWRATLRRARHHQQDGRSLRRGRARAMQIV